MELVQRSISSRIRESFHIRLLLPHFPNISIYLDPFVYGKMIRVAPNCEGSKAAQLSRNESPTLSTVSTDSEGSVKPGLLSLQSGIIKQCPLKSENIRTDRAGTVILTGSKSHRISFADEVQDSPRPIAKVHHVESFKKLNIGDLNKAGAGQPGCVCTIS